MKFGKLCLGLLLIPALAIGQVQLAWQYDSPEADGFYVERQLNGSPFAFLDTIAAGILSYFDGAVVGSTAGNNVYVYRVQAFTNAGRLSDYSNTVSETIPQIVPIPAPSTPSGLMASTISRTQILLVWNDTSDIERRFQAERSGNGEIRYFDYAMNQTSAIDEGLRPNTRYDYRLRAIGDGGASAWTSRVKTKTLR